MRLVRSIIERLRHLVREALAFGVIGAFNALFYFIIFNAAMGIGAIKATVLATVVTTTLSYLANRHWTYKHRPRTAVRREYTLFFAFNFAGMVIQSCAVAVAKYGLGYSEDRHRLAFNAFTVVGIAFATVFRFWAYRTFVFLKASAEETAAETVAAPAGARVTPVAATVAPPVVPLVVPQPRRHDPLAAEFDAELAAELDAELAVEFDDARRSATR